jgi:hypothetical protein
MIAKAVCMLVTFAILAECIVMVVKAMRDEDRRNNRWGDQ